MAEITTFPLLRHLRAEPTAHVLHYRRGGLARDGAGLAFWFRPIHTAVAEVPIDDRELPFLFHVRSADFQELTVQGAITFRVADPRLLARRVDFTIDLAHGPLDAGAARAGRGAAHPARAAVRDRRARAARPAHDPHRRRRADPRPDRRRAGGRAGARRARARGRRRARRGGDADRRGREGAAPADPRGDPAAAPTRRRSPAARSPSRRSARSPRTSCRPIELARREEQLVARRRQRAHGGRRPTDERRAARRPSARPTRSTWSRRARLRAERERAEIQAAVPPEVLLALALRELAGKLGRSST